MEEDRVRLARIEENVLSIRKDLSMIRKMTERIHFHEIEIALLKRDKKWESRLTHTVSGFLGAVVMAAVEWLRK